MSRDVGTVEASVPSRTRLKLAEYISDRPQHADIIGDMGEFSHVCSDLKQWFWRLLRSTATPPRLLLYDHTDGEIPWEMFSLGDGDYLGARCVVARWQRALTEEGADVLPDTRPDPCGGTVVAYIDVEELRDKGHDWSLFGTLNPARYEVTVELRRALECTEAGVGLVYLACHGFFGTTPDQFALGSEKNSADRLKLTDLRQRELALLRASRGVVFLNACESGRLVKNEIYGDQDFRRGFPELFLGKGAHGVIATLSKVTQIQAAANAAWLLATIQERPAESVAEHLRRLRERAATQLHAADEADPEQLSQAQAAFLFTFCYVYYGNPKTSLRLETRPGN
jgi:hypothetical protein